MIQIAFVALAFITGFWAIGSLLHAVTRRD